MAGYGSPPPKDMANHPSRKVHAEGWRGMGPWKVSGYYGEMTGQEHAPHEGHSVTSWEEGGQHTALVEHEQPHRSGVDVTEYSAGPFRTRLRAQAAASALSNRVPGRRAENYRGRTTEWTHKEMRD